MSWGIVDVNRISSYQLEYTQDDLLNFINNKKELDEYVGYNVYGLALAYIHNLESKVKELEASNKLLTTVKNLNVTK